MAQQSDGNALGTAFGWIGFAAVVLGWSYLNYRSNSKDFYAGCMESANITSMQSKDSYCSCSTERMMDELSLLINLPLIGGQFVPKDDELKTMAVRVGGICASRTPGVIFSPD